MAVLGVYGLPGAGKTTFLASCAMHSLSGKKYMGIRPHPRVYTTFACPGCCILEPDMIGRYNIYDSLLLIDEISQFFDSRDWKSFPVHVRTWFQLHRHFNCDVIFCSQSYGDADKRLRNLAEKYYLLEHIMLDISACKPIRRTFDISNGSLDETYSLAPPILWKIINRKKYYHLFDSYAQNMPLEEIPPQFWDDIQQKTHV